MFCSMQFSLEECYICLYFADQSVLHPLQVSVYVLF